MATSKNAMRSEDPTQSGSTGMRGVTREGLALARVEARRSGAFLWNASRGKQMRCQMVLSSARLRRMAQRVRCSESGVALSADNREISLTSCGAGAWRRRGRPLRKKIIGHEMALGISLLWKDFFRRGRFGSAPRPLALVYQQAREHGTGSFVDPLIEQSANLLPEIGGMTKTGEFIALERIPGSREKEFPGRLGLGTGHRRLLEERLERNSIVIHVNGTQRVQAVENCGKLRLPETPGGCREAPREAAREGIVQAAAAAIRACSACAGDYEDPDRTAWAPEDRAEDKEENAPEIPDEFPAEEQ